MYLGLFWKEFAQHVKEIKEDIILIGEVWNPDPSYVSVYQHDGITSVVDFPLYYALTDVFAFDDNMAKN